MPTLDDAASYMTGDGFAALAGISNDQVNDLRKAYWKRINAAGVDVSGKTFVDMDPFKSPALPLIGRLFPDAKIVIMKRDPRDVVWSCFRRSFLYSAVTYEFTSLDRAARHYDAVMQLISRCVDVLPIDTHTVFYENLVRDFDAVTRDLCNFVGIPWSIDVRNFGSTARQGRVKTASAAQVRGALFDGSGQWRRYADKIEPVVPVIARWIERQDAGPAPE